MGAWFRLPTGRGRTLASMRIVISGSSGLIGTALVTSLRADGHEVVRLVRRPPAAGEATTHLRVDWSGVASANWIGFPPLTDLTSWKFNAATNVVGNAVASTLVAKWEGVLGKEAFAFRYVISAPNLK